MQRYFAVIDTETNWRDKVMSIGLVIADAAAFQPMDTSYVILSPEYKAGGMYSDVLSVPSVKTDLIAPRKKAILHLQQLLQAYQVDSIFAYNATFDYRHLPELQDYAWFDIMKLAAYRQYNHKIPASAECCASGKMKRNYGVEPILQLLSGADNYREVHHALCDAVDELKIMKLLGQPLSAYTVAKILPAARKC